MSEGGPDVPPVSDAIRAALEAMSARFQSEHPLTKSIPMRPRALGRGRIVVEVTLPDEFVDDGVIHGGLYTILLDTFLAAAGWSRMERFEPLATINLKTDFFADSMPGDVVTITCDCAAIAHGVAFCHGTVNSSTGDPVAQAEGTFMIGTSSAKTARGSRL